jgi:hypothetical protein
VAARVFLHTQVLARRAGVPASLLMDVRTVRMPVRQRLVSMRLHTSLLALPLEVM